MTTPPLTPLMVPPLIVNLTPLEEYEPAPPVPMVEVNAESVLIVMPAVFAPLDKDAATATPAAFANTVLEPVTLLVVPSK